MTYKVKISSKGQMTIPVEIRRQLNLHTNAVAELIDGALVVKQPPSMAEAWAILDAPAKTEPLSSRERQLSEVFSEKDKQNRGY